MKPWIKWTAGSALLLAVVVAATAASGLYLAEQKRNRYIDIKPRPVAYTTDTQTIERGRYLFSSRGCAECHGAQGTGREFVNDGKGTRIVSPNITPTGVVARYQPADWNSVIRHGVKPNGRPVMVMPSEDYNRLSNDDLSALVSYVRQLAPPGTGSPAPVQQAVVDLPRPAWVAYGLGLAPDAAARIDHQLAPSRPVPADITLANGRYVANMCIGCHGADLAGGKIAGGPPDWPAASDIRTVNAGVGTGANTNTNTNTNSGSGSGSAMVRYPDAAAFVAMLRTGKRPDGSAIAVMPFESLGQLSEVDAQALYLFLTAPLDSQQLSLSRPAAGYTTRSTQTSDAALPSAPGLSPVPSGLRLPG